MTIKDLKKFKDGSILAIDEYDETFIVEYDKEKTEKGGFLELFFKSEATLDDSYFNDEPNSTNLEMAELREASKEEIEIWKELVNSRRKVG